MKTAPKIIIASDSFKGCLTSMQVADAAGKGIREVYPSAEIIKIQMADGGEGTTATIMHNTDGQYIRIYASDPLYRNVEVEYGLIDNGRTAIIEVAAASGLALLSENERNPMLTSTFGTGEMIADAIRRGCRKFIIGLGGSATNDCGLGMLTALGYEFYDSSGSLLPGCGASLRQVEHIDDSKVIDGIDECEFIVACDVGNPLYGPEGAANIFAPQKGADYEMIKALDDGLKHFSLKIKEHRGLGIADIPGSGAAGGLGGAFLAFMKCRLVSGIEMILDTINFDETISGADLIITGEGKIDEQTNMGKVPYGVLQRAVKQGIKVIAMGGLIKKCPEVESLGFTKVIQITPEGIPIDKAMLPEFAKNNIIKAIVSYLNQTIFP